MESPTVIISWQATEYKEYAERPTVHKCVRFVKVVSRHSHYFTQVYANTLRTLLRSDSVAPTAVAGSAALTAVAGSAVPTAISVVAGSAAFTAVADSAALAQVRRTDLIQKMTKFDKLKTASLFSGWVSG